MSELTVPNAPSLERIAKSNCCSGCGLCAGLSDGRVEMVMSGEGFLRPSQLSPLPAEYDSVIRKVCPGLNLKQTQTATTDHLLWGPLIKVRTGASTDPDLRHHASSGGVISALLIYILENGIADYVVQTGASRDAPLENVTVESLSREDIFHAAGSRYAPSAPLANIVECLDRPGRFVLVAKPCDIAAMRALGRIDNRVLAKIPLMISFFCAGIPSIKGAKQILDRLEVAESDVARFRYRGDGWPGQATATLADGRKKTMSYADSWGDILSRHVQFRCKICPDGSGGMADIVCADAWHSDKKGYPFFDEKMGRSLIVTRSQTGERYLQAAMAAGVVIAEPLDPGEVEKMQPSQAMRKRLALSRLVAMAVLGRIYPRYWGLRLLRAAISGGVWPNLKSFLGMGRRLVQGSVRSRTGIQRQKERAVRK